MFGFPCSAAGGARGGAREAARRRVQTHNQISPELEVCRLRRVAEIDAHHGRGRLARRQQLCRRTAAKKTGDSETSTHSVDTRRHWETLGRSLIWFTLFFLCDHLAFCQTPFADTCAQER